MAEITKQTTDKIVDFDYRGVGVYFGSFCIILITEAILSRVPESVAIFIIPINTTDLISSACDSHHSILENTLAPSRLVLLGSLHCQLPVFNPYVNLSSILLLHISITLSLFILLPPVPHPLLLASTAPFPPVTSPLLQY